MMRERERLIGGTALTGWGGQFDRLRLIDKEGNFVRRFTLFIYKEHERGREGGEGRNGGTYVHGEFSLMKL